MSLAKTILATAVAVVGLYTLYRLQHALLLLYVAIVLAILFDPLVERVRRQRVGRLEFSRGAATAVVCLLTVCIVALIGLVVGPPFMGDAHQLQREWPEDSARLFGWIHQHLPFSRSVTAESLTTWIRGGTGGSAMLTVGSTTVDILGTLLLAIYMLADGPTAFGWVLSLAPATSRERLRTALLSAARRMQGWVGGQGILMLTHGASALVTFGLLGLPHFLALGVFAAVVNIIPVLGPVATLLVAGMVAAINTPGKLLGVVIFYVVYHNAEGIYIQPQVMKSAVGVPGVAVILALLVGDEVAGIAGMALSVPTAVLIAEVTRQYRT